MNQRGIRMGPVFHARRVAAKQRRCHVFGHGEVDEFARARERNAYDLNRFGIFRIAVIDLQIVLRYVCRIRYPAADESQFAAERREPPDLGSCKKVFDFQEHFLLRPIAPYRCSMLGHSRLREPGA